MRRIGRGVYATGKYAKGECQRCGHEVPYTSLRFDGYQPNLRVCQDCWDPPHPQEEPLVVNDPIALRHPAPRLSIPDGEGDAAPEIEADD